MHEKSVGTADPSGEGGNDTQGTMHEYEAGHAGRDGKPVPYEGVRYCANVSIEFVGEAFRLPLGVRTLQMERTERRRW